MNMFISNNNSLANFIETKSGVISIAAPKELRHKKGQWYVKTHEIVTPLSKCGKTRLLANLIFLSLISFGFCWLAENVKRDASFYKAGKRTVSIYCLLDLVPKVPLPNLAPTHAKDAHEKENNKDGCEAVKEELAYFNPAVKADKDIIIDAIKQNPHAIKYAGDALKQDRDIVMAALGINNL